MRSNLTVALIFVLWAAVISSVAHAQTKNQQPAEKIIGEKGSEKIIGEKGTVAIIDDGVILFIGESDLTSLLGREAVLEVLGSEGSVIGEKGSGEVIGEKGSGEIIGEKGSGKIIGQKGSEKIIGEKGSGEIIGEKGRVVRDIKTGRTVQLVGGKMTGPDPFNKLNDGSRLRLKIATVGVSKTRAYPLIEPTMTKTRYEIAKVSVDGNVLAKNGSTAESFYFHVSDVKIRESLRAGQPVGIDRSGRWAFIRTSAVRGLEGQPATYSFPIRRDSAKSIVGGR